MNNGGFILSLLDAFRVSKHLDLGLPDVILGCIGINGFTTNELQIWWKNHSKVLGEFRYHYSKLNHLVRKNKLDCYKEIIKNTKHKFAANTMLACMAFYSMRDLCKHPWYEQILCDSYNANFMILNDTKYLLAEITKMVNLNQQNTLASEAFLYSPELIPELRYLADTINRVNTATEQEIELANRELVAAVDSLDGGLGSLGAKYK